MNTVEEKEIEYLKFLAMLQEGCSAPNPLTGQITRMGREDCTIAGHRVVTSLRRMVAEVAQSGFGGKVLPFLSRVESEEELRHMIQLIGVLQDHGFESEVEQAETTPFSPLLYISLDCPGGEFPPKQGADAHAIRGRYILASVMDSVQQPDPLHSLRRVGVVGSSLSRTPVPARFPKEAIFGDISGLAARWPKVEYGGDPRQINPRHPMSPEGVEELNLALEGRAAPNTDKAKARKGLDFLGGLGYRKGCKNGRL